MLKPQDLHLRTRQKQMNSGLGPPAFLKNYPCREGMSQCWAETVQSHWWGIFPQNHWSWKEMEVTSTEKRGCGFA